MTVAYAPSLARRLLSRLLIVFALAFAGSCALFLTLAWEQATIEIHGDLGEMVDALADSLRVAPDGQPVLEPAPALRKKLAQKGVAHVVIDVTRGRVLAGSATPIAPLLPSLAADGPTRMAFALNGTPNKPKSALSGFLVERTTPAGRIRIAVAAQERHTWPFLAWAVDELVDEVLPVGVPLFFTTLIVAAVTIRHTLRPVARLSDQAGAITPRTTGLRLEARKVPSEVLPLVQAFNAALERLDEGFALQRRFTANAAHQLRTPMAILRARLDGMAPGPEVESLKQDCDRIARVVSQLLAISRLEANQIEITETVDLGQLAASVVADMAPLAIASRRSLALEAPAAPVLVRGNSAALRDAVMNLIDNALRFGPPGQPVDIVLRTGARIAVADRGPGLGPQDRARVFEPFWRGRDPRGSGSGLGLAIVAEIALAHGGRASVAEREGGGAEFRVDLPQVATPVELATPGLPQAAQ
ncbi:MAG: HAMP domain-containing protein [Alphaproteobacteria bacterium]|nr:HAMP domain-containing protein [Alphaproteobacteria bacterium]